MQHTETATIPPPILSPVPVDSPGAEEKKHEDDDIKKDSPCEYERLVRRLYQINMFHPVNLGLLNIQRLHDALGGPIDRPNLLVVHVAGTNGKGSVAVKVAKMLQLSGYKTGLYMSPHISSFRERMQVNGNLISESEVETLLPLIFQTCEREGIPGTFFEVTTSLAFAYFSDQKVDAVVLETGLGGRLDATNVIKSPALSIITSIGLDHTHILGDTVEKIAAEKAGIIKPGRPVLVGPNVPHDVIKKIADDNGSEYFVSDEVLEQCDTNVEEVDILNKSSSTVDYDVQNSRIAWAAMELLQKSGFALDDISAENIKEGTSHRPPCRFETITRVLTRGNCPNDEVQVSVVLDVAHNPHALEYLLMKLEATFPKVSKRFVVGFSLDKDLSQCADLLMSFQPNSDPGKIHLVEASHPRAATVESMIEAAPTLRKSNFNKGDRSITGQVKAALEIASRQGEILVICGSVFIMAEARQALGYNEPRDSQHISGTHRDAQENFSSTKPVK